jgi:4-hydroxy-tetrahydrodipicolinate synthase
MSKKFAGIMPPILTPMHEDGSVDEKSMRKFVRFLVDGGVNAVVVNGTMGEFYALTDQEKTMVARLVIEEVAGAIPVVVGTGDAGTKRAVELAKSAEELGADAVQVMPPYYALPTDEGIYRHYQEICSAIDIPLFIYNNFGTTKVALSPKLISKIAKIPNVAGVKLSPGGPIQPVEIAREVRELTKNDRPELTIMIATTSLWYYGMELGIADGCVMGLPNVFPEEFAKIYKFMLDGKWEEARKLNRQFYELDHLALTEIGSKTRYQYMYKTLLMWRGIIPSNAVRNPLTPVEDYRLQLLRSAAKSLGYGWPE